MATLNVPVTNIYKVRGIAGQYAMRCTVQYPGEPAETLEFVGNVYGGPIVMVTPRGQYFVSRDVTDRIGSTLNRKWVLDFFSGQGE